MPRTSTPVEDTETLDNAVIKTAIPVEEVAAAPVITIKNFKSTLEIENFYRFVHENSLRTEARILMQNFYNKMNKGQKKRKLKVTLQ